MTRTRVFALLAGTASAVVAAAAQQAPYRGTTDLVSIYVTVVDDDGRLVTDLTKDDFEVKDDGRRQPLTFFSNQPLPFSAVVMLDRSGSMSDHSAVVSEAAVAFVGEMWPDDRARVGSFAKEIRLAPDGFTGDKAVLAGALREDPRELGPSPVWTAIDRSMTALLPMPDRRVVLVFTDGHDDPEYGQVRTSLSDLMRRTRVNGVMVYAIGFAAEIGRRPDPRQPRGFPIPGPISPPGAAPRGSAGVQLGKRYQPPDPALKDLARESGGGYFEMDEDADPRATFVRVAEELHRQYWLGYAPPALDGRTHEIEVKVRRRGLEVRARKHYLAAR